MILEVSYGIEVLPQNDPFIQSAETGMATVNIAGQPGAFLVDRVPILKYVPSWFPGASFKRKAKEWSRYADEILERPFKALKEDIVRRSHRFSRGGVTLLMSECIRLMVWRNRRSCSDAFRIWT